MESQSLFSVKKEKYNSSCRIVVNLGNYLSYGSVTSKTKPGRLVHVYI